MCFNIFRRTKGEKTPREKEIEMAEREDAKIRWIFDKKYEHLRTKTYGTL